MCRLFKSIRKGEWKRTQQSCSRRHFSNTWAGSKLPLDQACNLQAARDNKGLAWPRPAGAYTRYCRCDPSSTAPSLISCQHPCSISPGTVPSATGHSVRADLDCAQICSKIYDLRPRRTGLSSHSRREDNLHVTSHLSSFFIYE